MADFYKNCDHWCDDYPYGIIGREPTLSGVQYAVVTDMATEPVTLADFKLHARIDYNTDDALCTMYLKAARQFLEGWAQLSFGAKTMKLTALNLPINYRLMYGPVNSIITPDYKNVGDILKGGPYSDIEIQYTTAWPALPEAIKVAICRYAAGLYQQRENISFSVNGSIQEPQAVMDEAQKMVMPYMNITFP